MKKLLALLLLIPFLFSEALLEDNIDFYNLNSSDVSLILTVSKKENYNKLVRLFSEHGIEELIEEYLSCKHRFKFFKQKKLKKYEQFIYDCCLYYKSTKSEVLTITFNSIGISNDPFYYVVLKNINKSIKQLESDSFIKSLIDRKLLKLKIFCPQWDTI